MTPDSEADIQGKTEVEAESLAMERGRWLFTQECEFVAGAASADRVPPPDLIEIAFAGRSNVGKSSLVNALTGRKTLARTSHTPGRTRQLNFFLLGKRARDGGIEPGQGLYLVDLPGYGYAKAAKSEISAWTELVRDYLRGRPNLRRICVLIDCRHGLKPVDIEILDMLDEAAVSYQIILTKGDKLKGEAARKRQAEMAKHLAKRPAAHPEILLTSAHKGRGVTELRKILASLAV